jgi:hypothetical protein
MIRSGVPRGADGLVVQERLVVRLAQAIGPLRRGPERDAVAGLTSWDPPVRLQGATFLSEGCTYSVPSCCRLMVFVQQPAKSISATHPSALGARCPLELVLLRHLKLQRAVSRCRL